VLGYESYPSRRPYYFLVAKRARKVFSPPRSVALVVPHSSQLVFHHGRRHESAVRLLLPDSWTRVESRRPKQEKGGCILSLGGVEAVQLHRFSYSAVEFAINQAQTEERKNGFQVDYTFCSLFFPRSFPLSPFAFLFRFTYLVSSPSREVWNSDEPNSWQPTTKRTKK
jgi:hypothetical protein